MATPKKPLEKGMYNCKTKAGEEKTYHSSTINALKGTDSELTVVGKVEKYKPKKAKD